MNIEQEEIKELKEENKILEERVKILMFFTIILFITVVILSYNLYRIPKIVELGIEDINFIGEKTEDYIICSKMSGTPAWVMNGTIFGYGFKNFTEMNSSLNVVSEYLIPSGISFYYSSRCGWCHRQIEQFGEENWKQYQDAGLTVDCLEVLNENK